MYLFRVNVKHDGQDFAKGDTCPSDLVKAMLSQGLLEVPKGDVAPQTSELQVQNSAELVSEVVSEESDEDSEDADLNDSDASEKKKKKKGKK